MACVQLKKSKLKSLKKKYLAIPNEWKSFYPALDDISSEEEVLPKKRKKASKKTVPKKKRRVGRPAAPKPKPVPLNNCRFFSPVQADSGLNSRSDDPIRSAKSNDIQE